MDGKVSIIIPAYNHERYIGHTIESALEQTHENLEIIIINDGSTDRTEDVIRSYKDRRIAYFYQENQDAYNTINRGLGLATGDYISILNSDDIYERNRLERLLDLQHRNKAKCLFTDVIPISDKGEVFTDVNFGWNVWHQKNRSFYEEVGDLYIAFLKGNFMVTTSNLFMTAEAAKKVGKFCSLRYLHDYDYIFRMMLAFPEGIEYVKDEKLLFYRIHGSNTLSEAAIIGREQDKQLIQQYMLARIPREFKKVVRAGSDRLIELEQELSAVKRELSVENTYSIKQSLRHLLTALQNKVKLTFHS